MKNLLSKSLSKKNWAIISASLIVFAAACGFLIFETSKKTVALTLDGQDQVIKTHAKTIQDIFDDMDIGLRSEDYVFPSVNTQVKNNLEVVWEPAKQVVIKQGNEKDQVWTTADTVQELLEEQNVEVNKHDVVQPLPEEAIQHEMEVEIDKAFQLKVADGGKESQLWTTSTTVADFLSDHDIKLNHLDRVEPKLEETIKEDDEIKVIRVEKVTDVVEEPIRFAVVTRKDNSMDKGAEKVVEDGQEGLLKKEYEIVRENGKEVSRKLLSENTVKDKKDKVVAVGTKAAPVMQVASRGTNTNGQPSGKEMYVSSTAYTASCNGCSGTTATGINLKANPGAKVIAVDPSVIPLGTKVYVEGYGYAVAADTGSAIKGNKIDVFFADKSDAYRWGRKQVKIKILN
ncbi:G5 and 3D domain-containing protein [Cytobacillus purgationiresistens]|uniref:Uncharacterized protein YabE (DUF348 family) n=1 Tax=Cytobacillus purgationiresistens TaxID=863449 RepID=A0ABU0AQQ8_9BACI|nr:G5 and 3D domain-containing protein [Cytobacillus purgationiresistens]MDQ0273112.1 uncharacterized protein YabE (DUF348 family) [Cytobacillus purgationiresistens]